MKKLIVVGIFAALVGCGGGKGGSGKGGAGGNATGSAGAMGAAGSTGAGGSGACVMGQEGCACYGNDTCDASLQCLSHLCVATSSGAGGSVTGTGGSATGTGGSATGTGGSATGTGGSATGTGGSTTGTGGSSQCATGSEGCACYGNDTCNGSLKCLSHLCVSLTGTGGSATGTGGTTTGTGGSATGTGGSATGTGGTTGTAGTTGTGGSAPSNTLTFTAGVVTAGSNTWGITGGAYTFGDGVGSMITPNCSTDTCFGDVTGTGPICVSGIGTRVLPNAAGTDYDYATYWGAAVALDLNNPTNVAMGQQAYVASTHGVKGFQFTFQNRATSVVRLTFKVRDPSTSMLVDYCLDLGTTTSIIHFTDARQQCYLSIPGPALTAALADHVEGLQWQVPTTPAGAVSFDYCVSNITPLTQ